MRPSELAAELGISPKTLRAWLRHRYPRADAQHGMAWELTAAQVHASRARWRGDAPVERRPVSRASPPRGRAASDEAYVIDLCDELLGERALRQHRFDWLLGDPGRDGSRRALPVDAYYPALRLVVEYRERQHDEPVAFFDRRQTVSGVGRREQRRLYDERREVETPQHGLRLCVLRPQDLDCDARGRLRRNRAHDRECLGALLRPVIGSKRDD